MRNFMKTHPHAWWGLYLPLYLVMFFVAEHFVSTTTYWSTQLPVDDLIPFCEYFIVVYDLWSILLLALGIYLIFKDGEGFRRYMWQIAITFTLATVFCILVPNGQDLRPAVMEHQNIFSTIVQYTYAADTNTNVFPSVHVLGVMAALFAIWKTPGLRSLSWRFGCTTLGVLIICSTLLVKQHAVIDIIAALALSLIGYVVVYVIIGGHRDRSLQGH